MRYRTIGQSGIEASVVGFGAWAIGGWLWGGTDEADAVAAIHTAMDAGITLIDTAPAYGFGLSEQIVGKAIAGRRDKVVLATKCGLVWDTTEGTPFGGGQGKEIHRFLGPDSIRREVNQSLRRLGTDYVDLYQTHWQDPTTPIEETMAALLDLKQRGKIRAIGVSNATVEQMEEYRKVGPLDSDQERYSMLDRSIESDRLPYCRENGVAVLAYSPLAQGLLTGKIGLDREFTGDDLRRNNPRFDAETRRRVAAMLDEYKPIAEAHNLTFAQLAIAWTVAQPGLTFALVGARNPAQAGENAGAGDAVLNERELAEMDSIINEHVGAGWAAGGKKS
jgi:methylglyoxal reductase